MRKCIICVLCLFFLTLGFTQVENSAGDIVNYREQDGKIIVTAMVNGKFGDFVLDISGHCCIMEAELAKYNINPKSESKLSSNDFICRNYIAKSSALVDNINIGNVASAASIGFYVIEEEPYLRELGVIGTVNANIFNNVVLTIDTERKKITTTAPFRPPYMRLDYRKNCEFSYKSVVTFNITIDDAPCNVTLDTWNNSLIALTSDDYEKFSTGKRGATTGQISIGFGKNINSSRQFIAANCSFVKTSLNDVVVVENHSLKKSAIGLDFLKQGIISLDFTKGKVYFQPNRLVTIDDNLILPKEVIIEPGKLNNISAKYFKDNIYDYSKGGDFISKSDKIYVIDFWATWCGPCMSMMPHIEALAAKYKDRVIFCKINADKDKEICNAFSVSMLPTFFFIPAKGAPMIEVGATPEKFSAIIDEMLKK